METIVEFLQGVTFEAQTRGHKLISDQPPENQGADTGMTPPELLLAALGTCAGYYAAQYLRARSLTADGLKVRVTAEKITQAPARLDSFHIEVTAPNLDERHKDGILRAVKACLIHNTLAHPPAIETSIETAAAARV